MNKKIIATKGKLTTPLFCMFIAGNLVGCGTDKEEETFDINSFRVTSNVSEGGKVDLTSELVNDGDVIAITLTADGGYELESISGCEGQLVDNVYTTAAITGSCEVDVSYMLERVTVSISATAGGSVDLESQLINPGSKAIFNLTANEGFDIGEVSGCEGTLEEGMYITSAISAACEVSAGFVEQTFAVTTDVSEGGSVDLATQTITYGKAATITLTPDDLFEVSDVTGCDGTLAGNVYTTAILTELCEISAVFAEKYVLPTSLVITTTVSEGGSVDLATQTITYGEAATITLTPDDLFEVSRVTGCDGTLTDNVYTTALLTDTCEISAEFAEKGVFLTDLVVTSAASTVDEVNTMKYSATASFSNEKTKDVSDSATWTISDTSIATIDENGLVTPLKTGEVTVSVSYTDNSGTLTDDVSLTITPRLKIVGAKYGYAFAARKTDGSVVIWGDTNYGGVAGNTDEVADQLTDVHQIATSSYAFAAIKNNGTVVTWGRTVEKDKDDNDVAVVIGADSSAVKDDLIDVVSITSSNYAFAALKADGTVVAWGDPDRGGNSAEVQDKLTDVVSITSGRYAFAAIKKDGTVVTWGKDGYGHTTDSVILDQLVGVTKVVSNYRGFSALKDDGTVVSWGYSSYIDGYDADKLVNIKDIASNLYAFAAIKVDGSVLAWGKADFGGKQDDVKTFADVDSIVSNQKSFAAIKKDGTVVSWGDANYGADSGTPSAPLVGVVSIIDSYKAYAALKDDGTVATWGDADYGGTSNDVTADLIDVVSIISNNRAFAAMRKDGSVVTWGNTDYGHGHEIVTDVESIVSNGYAFAAIKNDGTVVTWGYAGRGDDSSAVDFN